MAHEATTEEAIARTAIPILEYGRGWMMSSSTADRGKELGLDHPLSFWANGRAGVLGEVDADLAAAAIGFVDPGMVRRYWDTPTQLSHRELTEAYAEAAAAWGRETLAGMADSDLDRLADLADAVSVAADPSMGMLFAGWRGLDRPSDPAGRATVALNVVRELRGGAHLAAVHAVGIGPHGAIMSADDPVRGGAAGAERFGWSAPHPEADKELQAEAERLTTTACRPAFDALSPTERSEFSSLVERARAAMDG